MCCIYRALFADRIVQLLNAVEKYAILHRQTTIVTNTMWRRQPRLLASVAVATFF